MKNLFVFLIATVVICTPAASQVDTSNEVISIQPVLSGQAHACDRGDIDVYMEGIGIQTACFLQAAEKHLMAGALSMITHHHSLLIG